MISYSVTGDDDAGDFFYVHPDNGDITLLQSVFETEKRQYKVCKQLECFAFIYVVHNRSRIFQILIESIESYFFR